MSSLFASATKETFQSIKYLILLILIQKSLFIFSHSSLNQDTCWSETGDRFMLKLFRNFIFHQVNSFLLFDVFP